MLSSNMARDFVSDMLKFIHQSPTAYHVCENVISRLKKSGFIELGMNQEWCVITGGKYCVKLNHSAVIAFAVGDNYQSGNGFSIIGTHTDSPHLKVKPNCDFERLGYKMVGVQPYGGGIWASWFDRDLTAAGVVNHKNDLGGSSIRLVDLTYPIMRIPHLAIHLDRDINNNFRLNTETKLIPVLALRQSASEEFCYRDSSSYLEEILAETLKIPRSDILDFDISLVDVQPPTVGGANNEFIFSPRLDNLFNVYCAMMGLISSSEHEGLLRESGVRMLLCYDNEEVGSTSYQGACTNVVPNVIKKIVALLGADYCTTLANSFFLSADQAHAVHPNYMEMHEERHRTSLTGGIVLKYNSNLRYATTSSTSSIVRLIAEKYHVPCQSFCVRNDVPCGSTIGPMASALLGIQCADVGFAMLSMHSIREMCATISVTQACAFYKGYYRSLQEVLSNSSQ